MTSKNSILFRLATLEKKFLKEESNKKDFWDKFGIITSFFSSVVLAAIATAFTISYQMAEQKHSTKTEKANQQRNIKLDKINEEQLNLRNIETVAKFLPFLTGKNSSDQSKKLALIAIQEFASTNIAAEYAAAIGGVGAEEALIFIAEKPDATCSDVGIATRALEMLREKSRGGKEEVYISGKNILSLFEMNNFKYTNNDLVFFAIRGAMPVSVSQSQFADGYNVQIPARNFSKMRDLIGQWRTKDNKIAIFPGSTLPSMRYLNNPVNPKGTAYIIPGLYSYKLGIHNPGNRSEHLAFRQTKSNPIARTKDSILGNSDDFIDFGNFGLNIRAAFSTSELETEMEGFNSAGGIIISGNPKEKGYDSKSLYQKFLNYAVDSNQENFLMAVFTVNDLISTQNNTSISPQFRYGSTGEKANNFLNEIYKYKEILQINEENLSDFEILSALNKLPVEIRSLVSGDCELITSFNGATLLALEQLSQKN